MQSPTPQAIFSQYSPQQQAKDSGSPESQIALWTHRIKHITAHLKQAPKDYAAQRGLIKLVGKRKRMMRYLDAESVGRARSLKAALSLRK